MEVIAWGYAIKIGEIKADGIGRFERWFVTNELTVSGVEACICNMKV